MKEGFWINYETGKVFLIDEHEDWIRNVDNAKRLGLSRELISVFNRFVPVRDREKFLVYLMKHAPIMRARGHGADMTFEYASPYRNAPMEAIMDFGKRNLGVGSWLNIYNLQTHEETGINFADFQETMETSGVEGVMRVASKSKVNPSFLKEMKKISRMIDRDLKRKLL